MEMCSLMQNAYGTSAIIVSQVGFLTQGQYRLGRRIAKGDVTKLQHTARGADHMLPQLVPGPREITLVSRFVDSL